MGAVPNKRMVAALHATRCKKTPLAVGLRLDDFESTAPDVDEPFRPLVGHLMWLASKTRPDILNAARVVARYAHAPKVVHWQWALHVLMRATIHAWLRHYFSAGFAGVVNTGLALFVDSDSRAKLPTGGLDVSRGVVV